MQPPTDTKPGAAKIEVAVDRDAALVRYPFQGLMDSIAIAAALTHLGFLLVFRHVGLDWLAAFNTGSILCYAIVFLLARRGAIGPAVALTVIEILVHAVLATVIIGWDSGFQYYLALLIPMAMTNKLPALWMKGALVFSAAAIYFVLDIFLRHNPPHASVPADWLAGLYYFNIASYLALLTFFSSRYFSMLNQALQALHEMALTDPLTGLHNRRAVAELIRAEAGRIKRGHPEMAFILGDLDHFKGINDTHGHDVGDLVLRSVSHALRAGLREVDVAGRWGGEEFLVVLPETDLAGAAQVAERLRARIEALEIPLAQGKPLRVSMTLGVAAAGREESADAAIARADAALYAGKRAGRNRVIQA